MTTNELFARLHLACDLFGSAEYALRASWRVFWSERTQVSFGNKPGTKVWQVDFYRRIGGSLRLFATAEIGVLEDMLPVYLAAARWLFQGLDSLDRGAKFP